MNLPWAVGEYLVVPFRPFVGNKDKNELMELLQAERQKILELRMKSGQSRPKNVKESKETRKTIARILTLLKQFNNSTI